MRCKAIPMTCNSYDSNNSYPPMQQKRKISNVLLSLRVIKIPFLFLFLSLLGCGYTLKGTHNSFYDKTGVQKIYIAPVLNKTYKVGIETFLYDSLVKTINANHQLTLVQDPKLADAILKSTITAAHDSGMSGTIASQLSPGGVQISGTVAGFQINTMYNANLACTFSIVAARALKIPPMKKEKTPSELSEEEETDEDTEYDDMDIEEGAKPKIVTTPKATTLWTTSLSRSEPFQSANQLDVPGTTSPLINESMFERALSDLATYIANDAHALLMNIF